MAWRVLYPFSLEIQVYRKYLHWAPEPVRYYLHWADVLGIVRCFMTGTYEWFREVRWGMNYASARRVCEVSFWSVPLEAMQITFGAVATLQGS